jgi:hypothetical protein
MQLTEKQISLVRLALEATLSTILPDLLDCAGEESLPKSELVECCLDADHLESNGLGAYGWKKDGTYEEMKEAIAAFRKLPFKEQDRIASETWSWKRCGM